jgi:hypothetical protein
MTPEERADHEAFLSDEFGQLLVDNLKRGIEENDEKRKRLMEAKEKNQKDSQQKD